MFTYKYILCRGINSNSLKTYSGKETSINPCVGAPINPWLGPPVVATWGPQGSTGPRVGAHMGPYGSSWTGLGKSVNFPSTFRKTIWTNFARFGSRNGILMKFLDDSASFLLEKLKNHVILIKNFNL